MKKYSHLLIIGLMTLCWHIASFAATPPTHPDSTSIDVTDTYAMEIGKCTNGVNPNPPGVETIKYVEGETATCKANEVLLGIDYKNQQIVCGSADACIGPGDKSVKIDP